MYKKVVVLLVLAGSLLGAPATAQSALVMEGATIIDGTGAAHENGVLVIKQGRIACVGARSDCATPQGAQVLDLSDKFITPGLIDAHVHFGQTGWLDGRPDGINAPEVYPYSATIAALKADPGRWHRAYLCSGITAVFDVGGQEWTIQPLAPVEQTPTDRVHRRTAGLLITHASANNLNFVQGDLVQEDLFLPFDSDEDVRAGIARVVAAGGQAIKVWFLDPAPERREELETRLLLAGKLSREAGLPLLVHATELVNAKAALRAGAAMLVHSVADASVDQEFLDLLIANDTFYVPTIVVGSTWEKAVASIFFERPVEIDDPNRCVDAAMRDMIANPQRLTGDLRSFSVNRAFASLVEAGRIEQIVAQNLLAVRDAGGRIVLGTDAGNPLALHGPMINHELEAMQRAGMAPQEIIRAATSSAAEALGLGSEIGTIEPGKLADLLVLAEDPREDIAHFRALTHVMRAGVLKTQKELQVYTGD